jgi:hypothetical protein
MSQLAPFPDALADLVSRLSYKEGEGWRFSLKDRVRDTGPDGEVLSQGLTLTVLRVGPDTYEPDKIIGVNHFFPVPPATYNERSWTWWLFECIGLVELHEQMENFKIGGKVVYPPAHGPGSDPYLVLHYGTDLDRRTQFDGTVDPA